MFTGTLLTQRADGVEDLDLGSRVDKPAWGAFLICIFVALHFFRLSTLKYASVANQTSRVKVYRAKRHKEPPGKITSQM